MAEEEPYVSIPRIVAIGASAGGVETLLAITRALPADFPAPVCIVLHISPHSASVLPSLINRAQRLEALHPNEGDLIQSGRIYIAPPDAHLIVRGGRAHLGKGPSENGSRPAIDPLFRSVAQSYGAGAIGVVLSGALDDGTVGLAAIKARGGIAIVQNPEEALYSSMPQSALDNVAVDHVVRQAELAALLERLIAEPRSHGAAAQGAAMAIEVAVAEHGALGNLPEHTSLGEPSGFACPDCHGVLWEIKEGDLIRFRCRVGHAYLPESLAAAQSDKLEEALWTAARALRESAALATRLAARATQRNMLLVAQAHEKRAGEARERALVIEEVLGRGQLAAGERQSY